ncbi:MAG: uridine kinase [bacterium]|nr:uridine kinase [bacterium]
MQKVIAELSEKIRSLKRDGKTLFVAIDGRGGSGKSTLAERLSKNLPNVDVVHLDDFAYPMQGADRERLLNQVILPLKNSTKGNYQRFDTKANKLAEWHEIMPGGIVIVEGVLTLHPILHGYYDFRIWIECPAELGCERGVARDIRRVGVDNSKQWKEIWMPEEKLAIEEHQPHARADYVIDGTKELS